MKEHQVCKCARVIELYECCQLCATHGFLQADCQVDHGHVGGGDTEGHAGQLAVKEREGEAKYHAATFFVQPLFVQSYWTATVA